MAKELLIRKQKGTHSPQCTSYRIVEPAWRFTLETCDEDVTGVIKDDVGNTIATVSAGAPAIVSRLGSYNVCVTGNGMGSLYVEWTDDTYVDQQCCNEVRKEFEQMLDDAIANVESKIPTSSVTVRGGENTEVTKSGNTYTVNATDTVTTLKAGNGISLQRNGYEYTVSSKVANVVAGENVSIQEGTESDGSPRFEISAVDTKPDVDKAYVDAAIAAIVDKDTVTTIVAGNQNVTITDSGVGGNHAYTISTVDTKPDVTKAYVDEQIASIVDRDTVTVVNAGENVSVSDTGTGGNHNYTISAVDTVTTVKAGNNVSVSKSGNEYTVSATIPSDTNTITTLTAGNNITLNDTGTGGNHNYVVSATDTVTTVKAGNNVSVSKSGDEYTVSATDTVTTVKAGTNVTVTKNGDEYTVSSTGGSGTDTVTTLVAGDGISITDSGTSGNHNYTVSTNGGSIYARINKNVPLREIVYLVYSLGDSIRLSDINNQGNVIFYGEDDQFLYGKLAYSGSTLVAIPAASDINSWYLRGAAGIDLSRYVNDYFTLLVTTSSTEGLMYIPIYVSGMITIGSNATLKYLITDGILNYRNSVEDDLYYVGIDCNSIASSGMVNLSFPEGTQIGFDIKFTLSKSLLRLK